MRAYAVSNLLGSPASGETCRGRAARSPGRRCFQFIGFPSEWGDNYYDYQHPVHECFQFIGFPSEWGVNGDNNADIVDRLFPIYWVPQRVGSLGWLSNFYPAQSFQFIGFPSEWGELIVLASYASYRGFQFIGFPSEWGDTPIETRMARACQGAFASISPNRYTLYCF